MNSASPSPAPAFKPIFDVTRLVGRDSGHAPTGIDRVEIAYAERFLTMPRAVFVRTTLRTGPQRVAREKVRDIVAAIHARWSADTDPSGELAAIERRLDRTFGVAHALAARTALEEPPVRQRLNAHRLLRKVRLLRGLRKPFRPDGDEVYFHVSHQGADRPSRFAWLAEHGVRAVFMCHDIIPIRHPEYVQPGAGARHRARIETMTTLADTILLDSEAVRADLTNYIEEQGLRRPPMLVSPLGLESVWLEGPDPAQGRRTFSAPAPYFLCIGTIEARKNHAFLLTLWRELVARHGREAPILLLVGKRGWQVESATALLERCTGFDGHVHELGSVSDATLRVLMHNAAGVLAPSFSEGYSYPPIEAMLAGVPVLASDIPPHREFLGDAALFLEPSDGAGWRRAIMAGTSSAAAVEDVELRAGRPDGKVGASTWHDHFDRVLPAFERPS